MPPSGVHATSVPSGVRGRRPRRPCPGRPRLSVGTGSRPTRVRAVIPTGVVSGPGVDYVRLCRRPPRLRPCGAKSTASKTGGRRGIRSGMAGPPHGHRDRSCVPRGPGEAGGGRPCPEISGAVQPHACCQSTPGNFPCQRSVDTEEFWVLGRGRWGERSLGGGFGRFGRRQDMVLPPRQAHDGGKQNEGGSKPEQSARTCVPPAMGCVRRGGQWIVARMGRIEAAPGSRSDGECGSLPLVAGQVPALMREVRSRGSAREVIDAAGGTGRTRHASPFRTP